MEKVPTKIKGNLKWKNDGSIIFQPDENGKWIIIDVPKKESPIDPNSLMWSAGIDPYKPKS